MKEKKPEQVSFRTGEPESPVYERVGGCSVLSGLECSKPTDL